MALLTPLNVNCHASDGRKVRAAPGSTAAISAPRGGAFALFLLLAVEVEEEVWRARSLGLSDLPLLDSW